MPPFLFAAPCDVLAENGLHTRYTPITADPKAAARQFFQRHAKAILFTLQQASLRLFNPRHLNRFQNLFS